MLGRIVGFALFATGDDFADDLAYLGGLTATGKLRAEIGTPAPWDETVHTIDEMRNRRTVGKTVLLVKA